MIDVLQGAGASFAERTLWDGSLTTWLYLTAIQTFGESALLRGLEANNQSLIWKMNEVPHTPRQMQEV